MSEVVRGVHPTVHAAYQVQKETLGVSTTARYNKLDRVAPGGSAALGRDAARLAEPVVTALRARQPWWLPGSQIKGLDGQHWSSMAHRLKALRATCAAPWPGQALVVLDPPRMVITDGCLNEDGHAQARRLLGQVLQPVSAAQRWIADRNFCTLGLLFGRACRGAACVVRQHGQCQGALLGRLTRKGASRSGLLYEQPLLVRDPESGETMRGRRMTVKRTEPTRNGDPTRHLLATVPLPRASAAHLARLDGKRWSIETAFVESPTTLACEIHTWGSPQAALCTFCLALLAYNAVALLNAALRRAHGRQPVNDAVSGYELALAMSRTYDGMMIVIPAPYWALFRQLSDKAFADVLHEVASAVNLARYQKHPPGPKTKPPARTAYQNGQHVSTAKLLAQR